MKFVKMTFEVDAETIPGENVFLCGNIREFGDWNVNNSLKLFTKEDLYPKWKIENVFIPVLPSYTIEYKYIKRLGSQVIWEIGENRRIYYENITFAVYMHRIDSEFGTKEVLNRNRFTAFFPSEEDPIKTFDITDLEIKYDSRVKLCPYHDPEEVQTFIDNTHKNCKMLDPVKHTDYHLRTDSSFVSLKGNLYTLVENILNLIELNGDKIELAPRKGIYSCLLIACCSSIYALNSRDSERFDLNLNKWIAIPSLIPSKEKFISCVVIDQRYIFVFEYNKKIQRLDTLDEESGWEELIVDCSNNFYCWYMFPYPQSRMIMFQYDCYGKFDFHKMRFEKMTPWPEMPHNKNYFCIDHPVKASSIISNTKFFPTTLSLNIFDFYTLKEREFPFQLSRRASIFYQSIKRRTYKGKTLKFVVFESRIMLFEIDFPFGL